MNITQNHIAESLALAASIVYWQTIKKSNIRWLPFFLLFILLVELAGNYLHKVKYANATLYNFTIPVEYLFYLFLFYQHGGKRLRYTSKVLAFLFAATSIVYFLLRPIYLFHSYVLVAGQASVVICACLFIYEQFQKSEDQSLLHNYFFWIASGLLLFNLGDLAYFLLYPVIHTNNWDRFDYLFKRINNSLLLLLYLSYIISFVVQKKYKENDA